MGVNVWITRKVGASLKIGLVGGAENDTIDVGSASEIGEKFLIETTG